MLGVLGLVLAVSAAVPELAPGVRYDARIPTLRDTVGHDFGEEITTPEGITRYLEALAKAAPDRTRLVKYATTWEGRPLHLLVVGGPAHMGRLDAIQKDLQRLADPRGLAAAEADRLVKELPVVVWLIHAVHGNEISSSDAALAEAYHLLAAQGDPAVDAILKDVLVLIDPLQNPDGRARFLAQNLLGRAAEPDPEPVSAEHDEPWPGGRANHYLFDMNRDYFSLSQPETRGRVATHLRWWPHVVVDLHEMGGESSYYFAPPAEPQNPLISKEQQKWFDTFGRANGARFDERGFPYFIREVYDSFYPGYGESWPIFQGAIGMTYEQASARGLVFQRRGDEKLLTYRDGVVHHFTAAIETAHTAARHRERLLADFLAYRRGAVAEGERGPVREYLLVPGVDPSRADRLGWLLAAQGIEVRRAQEPVRVGARELPAGTYVVSAAQPSGRLVRNLLDPHVPLDAEFLKEQEKRRKKNLPDQIYDVTAWSLPLVFDVESVAASSPVTARTVVVNAEAAPATVSLRDGKVGYLVPWGAAGAALAAEALRTGLTGRTAGEAFTLEQRRYGVGTVFFRASENPADLKARLGVLAARWGAEVVPIDSTFVEKGMSLGSSQARALKPTRIALGWDTPTSSLSAGWARWVHERRFGLPVTAVRVASLRRLSLDKYDVLVLPSGDYGDALGKEAVRRLSDWVRRGGTLVTLAEASRWAASEKAALLETHTELKGGAPEREPDEDEKKKAKKDEKPDPEKPFDFEKAIKPERERPDALPGALLRVELDTEHWLAAGLDGEVQAVVEGQRIFSPIKLDNGRNVGVYFAKDRLVASGLVWPESQTQLARKAFLIHQPLGEGHVIAFAEDPNFRGFAEATELLFLNSVLLGPAQ
jgi:hypothetical protein